MMIHFSRYMADGRISVSNHFEIQAILCNDAADFMVLQCSKTFRWVIKCSFDLIKWMQI